MAKADKSKNTKLKKATKTVSSKSRTQNTSKKNPVGGTKVKAVRGKTAVSVKSTLSAKTKSSAKKSVTLKKTTATQKRATKKTVTPSRPTVARAKTTSRRSSATTPSSDQSGRNFASTEELRNLLLERRKDIMKNFDGDIDPSDETKFYETVGDAADIAQESSKNELTFHLAEVESRELAQIDKALERIGEGAYGLCEKCGEKISLARLKALPFAVKCIRCQEEDEQEIH